jgi:phosphoserine phosphatase RsbU/P
VIPLTESKRNRATPLNGTGRCGVFGLNDVHSLAPTGGRAAVVARAELEAQMAQEVQAGLFPRSLPRLKSLSYAGVSLPAGLVGGDYYDFLDLGRGYLGMVVGDVSGKGVAAALLMANLQAHVRSQCALAPEDLGSVLRAVNRMFLESTLAGRYATVFFGEYRDADRRLRYVNCGHPAALVCHADGSMELLAATATVLGLGEDWDCEIGERRLAAGDRLLIYTDGVTEAANERGEEFGEYRLASLLSATTGMPTDGWLQSILEETRRYTGREFQDDVTLVGACCRYG